MIRSCRLLPPSVRLPIASLAASLLLAFSAPGRAQDVLTYHNDMSRSGVKYQESILTWSNVRSATFGKKFSLTVSGDVYAQPLYVSQYAMSDGKTHNVLFVATTRDLVYAFDADGNNPAAGYLWKVALLGAGETYVSYNDVGTDDIQPDIGIIGTPVIDRTTGTLYVVSKSKITSGSKFIQRLHALNLASGAEKLNGPTTITASRPGTGDAGTTVTFNAQLNNQRASLLLAPTPWGPTKKSVYIAWASHGDNGNYHGWVLGYDAANISTQTGAYVASPNGMRGGVWLSGGGLSADANGRIYAVTANGTFDGPTSSDYGDTALQLQCSSHLGVDGYFTPDDQAQLSGSDSDMGVANPMLVKTNNTTNPNVLITADKTGHIYLLNPNKLGGYNTNLNKDVQDFHSAGTFHNNFAYFNHVLYVGPDGNPLTAYTFDVSTAQITNVNSPTFGSHSFGCNGCDGAGTSPSISVNGTSNVIVWAVDNSNYGAGPAILFAYQGGTLKELYDSQQAAGGRDTLANAVKFTTPTVANGRVYVGGHNAVTVFGLR